MRLSSLTGTLTMAGDDRLRLKLPVFVVTEETLQTHGSLTLDEVVDAIRAECRCSVDKVLVKGAFRINVDYGLASLSLQVLGRSLQSSSDPCSGLPHLVRFPSALALCLHLCRHFRLLKNDKTLLLPAEDVLVKLHHLQVQENKKVGSLYPEGLSNGKV